MAKRIQILVDEDEHRGMLEEKGDRSWREVLEDGLSVDDNQ